MYDIRHYNPPQTRSTFPPWANVVGTHVPATNVDTARSSAQNQGEQIMRSVRAYLQHRLNPLHIYCRLCECGISPMTAKRLSCAYERIYKACGLC